MTTCPHCGKQTMASAYHHLRCQHCCHHLPPPKTADTKSPLRRWTALGPDLGQLIDNLFIFRFDKGGGEPTEWEKGVRARLGTLNLEALASKESDSCK
jgi:hypothetical protein